MKWMRGFVKTFFFLFLALDIAVFGTIFYLDMTVSQNYKIKKGELLSFDTTIPITAVYEGVKMSQSVNPHNIGEYFDVELKAFGVMDADGATWLGHYLFDDAKGKDCYMEDLATLWLLHFHLVFLREATLYSMFFCGVQRERSQFEREQVQTYIKLKVAEAGKQYAYNDNTVKKDIGVLLQNYALPRKSQSNEDFSSLLIDLDLIRQNATGRGYYFNVEGKRKVTPEVFMYGLLMLKQQTGDSTISFESIQDQVGLAFCMTDHETVWMLKQLTRTYGDSMSYNEVAGIRQVQFTRDMDYKKVLDDYYEAHV